MINLNLIKALASDIEKIHLTLHLLDRLRKRNISVSDVINGIQSGEIIEQYPDDYPHPSCLVFGKSINQKALHIVCGTDGQYLWIITAYYPDIDKWENDLKTRREKQI